MRPTELLRRTQTSARSPEQVLDPADMGAARYTRHSFARSFLRTAAAENWRVERERWDVDADGRGEVVYRVGIGGREVRFVVFSTTLAESDRTDRVIAKAWDVTAALIEGPLTESRSSALRVQVPRQEEGRADDGTLIWTRANRSARFFDYVADRLSAGSQPDIATMGDAAYILRSTAFYSNGKFGLADFDRLGADHPLRLPYRAHMLTAWLLREFSYDLVEHCARARNPRAARLSGDWRRYLGLGNATGLGMVPYVVNHPQVLDAWCATRELPLAHALAQTTAPGDPCVHLARDLLDRATLYFAERAEMPTAPFVTCGELSSQLDVLRGVLSEYIGSGTIDGRPTDHAWQALHDRAASIGAEARGVMDSVIVEVHPELDTEVEELLYCDQRQVVRPAQTCAQLRAVLRDRYAWVQRFDFDDPDEQTHFWFSSENNEEPRRGRRGVDPGEHVEHPIDVARSVAALERDLESARDDAAVAAFLVEHPRHRGTVARVQTLTDVPYAEARDNLLARNFLPLNLQRFQLAMYGMDNYMPQSTDWLRVTLYSGAPRAEDVAAGVDDDWIFTRKPRKDA
ncbi:hypothetical protein JWS13_19295 [Rhodococcus pseudokoreensis]|uniref:Uncharacterized protein n=1 Tax=Rhodococcus pseudokoreensis TaxID=2811421 RepID=A0A974W3G8_9NOCA|nr:hypothetical protein [Rhodococcus pseudokoreensis]QSE90615.1 hypothetical protein JWS13_19295 [Rhodococcus pseudokoreensis]